MGKQLRWQNPTGISISVKSTVFWDECPQGDFYPHTYAGTVYQCCYAEITWSKISIVFLCQKPYFYFARVVLAGGSKRVLFNSMSFNGRFLVGFNCTLGKGFPDALTYSLSLTPYLSWLIFLLTFHQVAQ